MTARHQPSVRDRQRDQIRAEIRRVALRLFVEHGFDAVTTEQIAAAAGVAPRTFFRHISSKDDILLGPVRRGGTAIAELLEQRPAGERPDVALINAILARAMAFDDGDSDDWRKAILVSPHLLDRVTMLSPVDRNRIVKQTAARMHADPEADIRPALLVHLAFAAGDFAFQQWVRQPAHSTKTLRVWFENSLEPVNDSRWQPMASSQLESESKP